MRYQKQIIGHLEKCYALAQLRSGGETKLLVAAEKHSPCYLFGSDGIREDTLWEEPGGVMTMVPVPGRPDCVLSTHRFYSPNDSAEASLVCAERQSGGWKITTIAPRPFVHRFDVLPRNGVNYLLACTLKSGHACKNDWSSPGKLWTGVLGEDPAAPLQLSVLWEGLGHNHGYTRYEKDGVVSGVVSCDRGVFLVTPPASAVSAWEVTQLLDRPASDAVLLDLDGDGQPELLTVSPFHGDRVEIWHLEDNGYTPVFSYPERLPFLHAICGGEVYGRPTVYIGNREGDRLLLGFFYDSAAGEYSWELVDRGAGPANVMLFSRQGHPSLLAANRETDEIAIYDILPE